MLTCPNALWKTGLATGLIFSGITMIWSLFITYVLNALVSCWWVVSGYQSWQPPALSTGSW